MATLNLADGESFVKGRSTQKARELLELAGDRAAEVVTNSYGYIVPTEILPEDYDAITNVDLPAVRTQPGTSTNVDEVYNKGGEPTGDVSRETERETSDADAAAAAEAEAAAKAEAEAAAKAEAEADEQGLPASDAEVPAYDPADHTISEVEAYLEEADDEERARVIAAEEAGKQRKGVLDLATTPDGAK